MSSRPPALRLGALPSDDHPVLTQSLLSLFALAFILQSILNQLFLVQPALVWLLSV